jgi:hypothetical protein
MALAAATIIASLIATHSPSYRVNHNPIQPLYLSSPILHLPPLHHSKKSITTTTATLLTVMNAPPIPTVQVTNSAMKGIVDNVPKKALDVQSIKFVVRQVVM